MRSLRLAPFVTGAAAVAAFLAARRGDTYDVIADLRVLGLLPALAGDRWALGHGLTVELAAALIVIWAVAAWGRRHGLDHPGIITTPALPASLFLAASISRALMIVGPVHNGLQRIYDCRSSWSARPACS